MACPVSLLAAVEASMTNARSMLDGLSAIAQEGLVGQIADHSPVKRAESARLWLAAWGRAEGGGDLDVVR